MNLYVIMIIFIIIIIFDSVQMYWQRNWIMFSNITAMVVIYPDAHNCYSSGS